MKHNYKLSVACLLAGAALATPAIADKAVKTVSVNTYGDYMTGGNELQSSLVSYFDASNKLVRKGEYGLDGSLLQYYTYQYNDKGQLALSFSRQVTILSNGMSGFYDATDSVTYEYDELGRLVAEIGQESCKYTYDDKGNLTSKSLYTADWDTGEPVWSQTLTYSDFIAPNCPQKVSSKGQYESDTYESTLTYNSANQLLKESRYAYEYGSDTLSFQRSTTNYYDDNGLLVATVQHQIAYVYDYDTWEQIGTRIDPVDSIVYTRDGLDTKTETYTYDSYSDDIEDRWIKSVTYTVATERELDGALASGIAVEAVEGKRNTNKITVDAAKEGYAYGLYRDGAKIATLSAADGLTYTDEQVQNGQHDYFVQTVGADSLGYNVSAVASVDNYTKLPAPTNVRGIGKKNESLEGYDGTSMYVAWDAPENAADYGFMGYNVMEHGTWYDAVFNEGLTNEQSIGIDMFDYYTEKTIYVQAVYGLGVANSDTVTINIDDLPLIEPSAIKGAVASAAGKLSYANGVISLDGAANISVTDMGGRKVAEAKNATSLSLGQLPGGVYVVAVECGGKLSMAKIRK